MSHSGSNPTKLTPKRQRAIAALLSTSNVSEAAEMAKVSRRTLTRWLGDPDFRTALIQAEGRMVEDALRALIGDMVVNLSSMITIRDDLSNSSSVRLRASQAIDSSLYRWRGIKDLEERISVLEAMVYEQK